MKILLLTSGGDAPGMNKFVAEIYKAFKSDVFAVKAGFTGLINGDIKPLSEFNPLTFQNEAGSSIYSSRCPEFATEKGFQKGLKVAKKFDAVIILGGNGSCKGAKQLSENGVRTVFIPATIDNDVDGSEYSIGFHTAVKACCDYVYSTMPSMQAFERCCLFEVMGRKCNAIAKNTASVVEADALIADEKDLNYAKLAKIVKYNKQAGRASCIIVRENIVPLSQIIDNLKAKVKNVEFKGVVIGHIQRGTKPTKVELNNAKSFARACVKGLKQTSDSYACVFEGGKVKTIKF